MDSYVDGENVNQSDFRMGGTRVRAEIESNPSDQQNLVWFIVWYGWVGD